LTSTSGLRTPEQPQEMNNNFSENEENGENGEACPFCGYVNRWGERQTCSHNVGVVIDSYILESTCLNSIWSNWAELCVQEVYLAPKVVLKAWARHLNLSNHAFITWLDHAEEGHQDLDLDEFIELCSEVFGLESGSIMLSEGMLSGSAYCLYVQDHVCLEEMDAMLQILLSDLHMALSKRSQT